VGGGVEEDRGAPGGAERRHEGRELLGAASPAVDEQDRRPLAEAPRPEHLAPGADEEGLGAVEVIPRAAQGVPARRQEEARAGPGGEGGRHAAQGGEGEPERGGRSGANVRAFI
jgi:hypothetical protein